MQVRSLEELFHETLKDVYYTEQKLVKALPELAGKSTSPDLKGAIDAHLAETEFHVERLGQVFAAMGKKAAARKCEAIEGLLREADEILSAIEDQRAKDAAIIASAQTVEHYEIARYGTLVSWARELGLSKAESLLQATLDEEKAADEGLSRLAEGSVNAKAAA